MIKVEIASRSVLQALDAYIQASRDPRPMLEEIGEYLVDATKLRFSTSTAPDGTKWAPNSPVTILRYLSMKSGEFDKAGKWTGNKKGFFYQKGGDKGRIASKGIDVVMGKRPLMGETSSLSSNIFSNIEGNDVLLVGSPLEYAAAQQFGMKRGYAGTDKRGRPLPWGDIPAREFLGVSSQDEEAILDILEEHFFG